MQVVLTSGLEHSMSFYIRLLPPLGLAHSHTFLCHGRGRLPTHLSTLSPAPSGVASHRVFLSLGGILPSLSPFWRPKAPSLRSLCALGPDARRPPRACCPGARPPSRGRRTNNPTLAVTLPSGHLPAMQPRSWLSTAQCLAWPLGLRSTPNQPVPTHPGPLPLHGQPFPNGAQPPTCHHGTIWARETHELRFASASGRWAPRAGTGGPVGSGSLVGVTE